jgi:hypothetical protein
MQFFGGGGAVEGTCRRRRHAAGGVRLVREDDGFRVVVGLAGAAEHAFPERLDVDRHRVHELDLVVTRVERRHGPGIRVRSGAEAAERAAQPPAATDELHDDEDDDDEDDAADPAADRDGDPAAAEAHPAEAAPEPAGSAAILDL